MNADARQVAPVGGADNNTLVRRIGQLTRMLRQSMRELGLNEEIEKAAQYIPDARDRLNYVARMTEQAAERSLNAIDRAQPLQEKLGRDAQALGQQWQAGPAGDAGQKGDDDLVAATRAFLDGVPSVTQKINGELLEIMMAQDFQDLTGQVIKKMMEVIHEVEKQLFQVLLDSVPDGPEREEMQHRLQTHGYAAVPEEEEALINGPQVRDDTQGVVNNQDQVDDLLDELGF